MQRSTSITGSADTELPCRELVELVTEYLDGALAVEARARFEEHLERCAGCERYLEQLRQTVRLAALLLG